MTNARGKTAAPADAADGTSAYEGRVPQVPAVHSEDTTPPATGVGAQQPTPAPREERQKEGGGAAAERD
jgi:hypothetical protein